MKTLLSAIVFCLAFTMASYAQDTKAKETPAGPAPAITFENEKHDFGDITQGEIVSHTFKFKNTGKSPLIISNVATTCGCTVPSYPKEPIAPGKTGEISATFNSAGKMGQQNKVITIQSNAPESHVTIISNVLPPKASK